MVSNLQLEWTEDELLATDDVAEPLVVGGVRCHGGFDDAGAYHSPRTRHRVPAIDAWQQHHAATFGADLIDVPLSTWPETYPNIAQAKFLIREGVPGPVITTLTRIGTVEGFGAMIRYANVGDPQRHFDESVSGTALAHLHRGLFEAHARDEAGFDAEAGHKQMWFAARDVAFENPVTQDETARMLERMGIGSGGSTAPDPQRIRRQMEEARVFADLNLEFEMLIQRMINILLIEISAFHTFAWAESVLSDTDLVGGEGAAGRLVSYIRQDETPHVEYLKTALTEMRDRTFIGDSGRKHAGTDIVGGLWERGLAQSLGPRREQTLTLTLREVEHALDGNPRRDALLEEFHAHGTIRPTDDGAFVAVETY
jgi:hypothetical protein